MKILCYVLYYTQVGNGLCAKNSEVIPLEWMGMT